MIGKTISHYKIIEKIGSGGMGVVYKAQDLKLDRFVALKFLPPHLTTSDEEKQRFIHEAKAASALQHHNICTIHEIDETDDGQLFICMDYYEGDTLDERTKEKPLPIEDAIDIATQIAQGLTRAHEKEIIHRDIKPANIMLTSYGIVKILDFGLAKLSKQTKLTKEGTTLGTIAYMSPEQTRGEAVDHRSDIWSFGVILYEMISGKCPFKGDYDQALIYGIANEQPEPLTALRSGVPLELERIVNRCMSKDPQYRYQHADDLISELNRLKKESELGIIKTQTGASETRFKSVLLPAAIVFIVCLIIIVYLLLPSNEEKVSEWENSIAVLPFDNISNDPEQDYFCDGMTEQLISNLGRLPNLKVSARQSVMKYKDSDKTIPEIGEELNVTHVLESSIRKAANRIRVTAQLINTNDGFHLWSQDFDRTLDDIFDIQDDISDKIATNLLATLSPEEKKIIKTQRPNSTEAYQYFLKGKHFHYNKTTESRDSIRIMEFLTTAENMYRKAIQLDPNYADSYAGLADIYNSIYNWFKLTDNEVNRYWKLQKSYLDTALQLDSSSTEAHWVKNFLHQAKAKKYGAEKEYEKMEYEVGEQFKCLKRTIKNNSNLEREYIVLSRFYNGKGLYNLSIKACNKSLELNPLQLFAEAHRANSYLRIGEFREAEIGFQKVLEAHPKASMTLRRYAELLIATHRYAEAESLLVKIEKIYPDYKTNWEHALIYASKGEKKKALDTYKGIRSLSIYSLLGMKDEAVSTGTKWSEGQFQQKNSQYYYLKTNPFYENIRSDPRFQEILAKHKELYEENLAKYGDINI